MITPMAKASIVHSADDDSFHAVGDMTFDHNLVAKKILWYRKHAIRPAPRERERRKRPENAALKVTSKPQSIPEIPK